MKKAFLVIAAFVLTVNVMAQVKFAEGSLKEVLAQAKAENKRVIVFASASWCGPCKQLVKEVFPLKEVSDYINSNYLMKKYELDIADPDNINRYNIKSYPTFIFVDSNGKEMNRMVGAAKDGNEFIKNVKQLSDPSNRVEVLKTRFIEEPSYAVDYLIYLDKMRMYNEINDSYEFLVKNRTIEELFNQKNVAHFKSKPLYLTCPLILFMVKNSDAIIKHIGKKDFDAIIAPTVNEFILGFMLGRTATIEKQREALTDIAKREAFNTPLCQFINSSFDSMANKEIKTTLKNAQKYFKGADESSRLRIALIATRPSIWEYTRENQLLINKFLKWCLKFEDVEFNINKYNFLMEKV